MYSISEIIWKFNNCAMYQSSQKFSNAIRAIMDYSFNSNFNIFCFICLKFEQQIPTIYDNSSNAIVVAKTFLKIPKNSNPSTSIQERLKNCIHESKTKHTRNNFAAH